MRGLETLNADSSPTLFGNSHAPDQHEVSVALKLVQVQVVDKKGRPVRDLEKADFILIDNGRLRDITDFEKHISLTGTSLSVPRPSANSGISPKLNRKFIFFFDFAFNNASGIIASKKAALNFIDTRLYPDDEIAVISFAAHQGLQLHEFLTKEHAKVRQIIDRLGVGPAMGRAVELGDHYWKELKELNEALSKSAGRGGSETLDWIEITKDIDRSNYENCVSDFAIRMKELASAIGFVPGQKNIIFFSSGITNFVLFGKRLENYTYSLSEKYGSAVLRERFSEMCKALASANCTLHTINVAGLASGRFDDRNLSGELSLKQMASETGGRYFDNIRYYPTINEEIQESSGSYYVLGYYIDEETDGKYHKIDVKVKRKNCRVHAQRGYFNPRPFAEYSANENLLHLFDLALSETPHFQEAIEFPLVPLRYDVKEKSDLVIIAKIPAEKIEHKAGQRIEVITLIFDQKGDVVFLRRKLISGWSGPSGHIFLSSFISLDPGNYRCRMVLRNMETGRGARGSCRVDIPKGQVSTFIASSPLLLMPAKGEVFREAETEAGENSEPIRFTDIYPFNKERYRPLLESLDRTDTELFVMVRCLAFDPGSPEISFSSYVVAASGNKITVPTSIVNRYRTTQIDVYELRLMIGELRPGEYSLCLLGDEGDTGLRLETTSSFMIK